jgi:hypothetical protein
MIQGRSSGYQLVWTKSYPQEEIFAAVFLGITSAFGQTLAEASDNSKDNS